MNLKEWCNSNCRRKGSWSTFFFSYQLVRSTNNVQINKYVVYSHWCLPIMIIVPPDVTYTRTPFSKLSYALLNENYKWLSIISSEKKCLLSISTHFQLNIILGKILARNVAGFSTTVHSLFGWTQVTDLFNIILKDMNCVYVLITKHNLKLTKSPSS